MPVTHEEGDRYPLRPPVFADVAQRKSIRLISERPTFRNCPSVPVLESIQQIKNFNVNEKKRILLYFWSLFPSADCKSVAFNWRVAGGWFDSFRLHQLPTYIKYVIIALSRDRKEVIR